MATSPGGISCASLRDGIAAIAHNRVIRAILALIAISSVGEGMMSTLFAVYVTRKPARRCPRDGLADVCPGDRRDPR